LTKAPSQQSLKTTIRHLHATFGLGQGRHANLDLALNGRQCEGEDWQLLDEAGKGRHALRGLRQLGVAPGLPGRVYQPRNCSSIVITETDIDWGGAAAQR